MQVLAVSAIVVGAVAGVGFLVWLVWYASYKSSCDRANANTDKMMSMMASGRGFAFDGSMLCGSDEPPRWLLWAALVVLGLAAVLGLVAGAVRLLS